MAPPAVIQVLPDLVLFAQLGLRPALEPLDHHLRLFEQWLAQEVRFIVRLRKNMLRYDVQRVLSGPRRIGRNDLELDALVRLGSARTKALPTVRLIVVRLHGGELLSLATERMAWSTERVLEAYRKLWHIERFHRLLKDTLGLSHLYSFQATGIALLIYTALLTVLLPYFAQRDPHGDTIDLLRQMLMTGGRRRAGADGRGERWRLQSTHREELAGATVQRGKDQSFQCGMG